MKTNITVSFVLPVYNAAPYLRHCLESVLRQSLMDYEIILVNDGSTDNSLTVCREYETEYDFIHVIDQPNQGVSVARNRGILYAKGKYICFLDADDYYITDFAKDFYNKCEENKLDIIRGLYSVTEGDCVSCDSQKPIRKLSSFNKVMDGGMFLYYSMREHSNEVVPWLGYFRRDYLLENSITFPVGISFEEDQIFFLQALIGQPCRVMQVPVVFYAYRQSPGSATSNLSLKKAQDTVFIVESELELAKSVKQKKVQIAAKRYAGSSFFQLTNIYGRVRREERLTISRMCSLGTKMTCIIYTANMHQRIKNAAFTFLPQLLGIAYDVKGKE